MFKRIFSIAIIVLTIACLLTACGKVKDDDDDDKEKKKGYSVTAEEWKKAFDFESLDSFTAVAKSQLLSESFSDSAISVIATLKYSNGILLRDETKNERDGRVETETRYTSNPEEIDMFDTDVFEDFLYGLDSFEDYGYSLATYNKAEQCYEFTYEHNQDRIYNHKFWFNKQKQLGKVSTTIVNGEEILVTGEMTLSKYNSTESLSLPLDEMKALYGEYSTIPDYVYSTYFSINYQGQEYDEAALIESANAFLASIVPENATRFFKETHDSKTTDLSFFFEPEQPTTFTIYGIDFTYTSLSIRPSKYDITIYASNEQGEDFNLTFQLVENF